MPYKKGGDETANWLEEDGNQSKRCVSFVGKGGKGGNNINININLAILSYIIISIMIIIYYLSLLLLMNKILHHQG